MTSITAQPYAENTLDRSSRSIAVITGLPGKHRAETTLLNYQRPRTGYRPRHSLEASWQR